MLQSQINTTYVNKVFSGDKISNLKPYLNLKKNLMPKHDKLVRIGILLLLFGVMPNLSIAQNSELKPVSSSFALKNVTIVQAPGRTIENGTVIIENGIIKSVGKNIAIPAGAWEVAADSMYVYAGFISGMSTIGANKREEREGSDDRKLTGNPSYERAGITPNVNVRATLNPKEKSISSFRDIGFTAAHTVPHGGMISGTGAVILLGGDTGEGMLINENISMFSQWQGAGGVYPNTVIGIMAKYRDMYRKAEQAKNYSTKYQSGSNGMERPDADEMIESLFPVVSKQMPVAFKAESLLDITRALTLKNDLGFDIILGEVRQAWDVIPQIKNARASVFLSFDLPEMKEDKEKKEDADEAEEDKEPSAEDIEREALEKRKAEMVKKYYAQPGELQTQGVKFGFSTLEGKSKDFKANMMKLIENGLSEETVLAALTTNPAEILGVSSLMGTVDNGKMANLVVTDKPYFDKESNVRYVFVDGEKYDFKVKEKKKKKSSDDAAIEIAGKWSYTVESPQGQGTGVISIAGTDGEYEGTISVSYNDSTNEIQDIEIDGSTLSFSFVINMGQDATVEISVEIDEDTFEGSLSVPGMGSFPMTGSKEPGK